VGVFLSLITYIPGKLFQEAGDYTDRLGRRWIADFYWSPKLHENRDTNINSAATIAQDKAGYSLLIGVQDSTEVHPTRRGVA